MGKVKVLAVDLDVEQFIQNVQERPVIWDRHIHVQKQVVYQMWKDLSHIHGLSSETLKAKWKGLRDNFRVEYKRIPRNANDDLTIDPADFDSKWTFYKNLLFLSDHMRSRNPKNIHSLITELSNDLIQIPDDTNAGRVLHHDDDDVQDDEDTSTTDFDEDANNMLEIEEKYTPINLTRRNVEVSHNNNTSATSQNASSSTLGQPILLLDEFLRSKALPAKKRKLTMTTEDTVPTTRQVVITKVPKLSGGESPYRQQPVSTSTPMGGGSIGSAGTSSRMDGTIDPGCTANFLASMVGSAAGSAALSVASSTPINDDYHFLMSLYPYMAKLSDTQKLRLRMKIQGLVYQELYSDD